MRTSPPEVVIFAVSAGSRDAMRVRAHVANWVQSELMQPSYWIWPQALSAAQPLDGVRVDAAGETSVNLLAELGAEAWARVRLVIVQLCPTDGSGDEALAQFGRKLRDFLKERVFPANVPVDSLNVIVPATDVVGIPDAVLATGDVENVILAPEERVSPGHPNVMVRYEENFLAHAAVGVASLASLWVGMDTGPFDEGRAESGDGAATPVVARAFVRVVRGERLSQRVAEAALDSGDEAWRLPRSAATSVVPAVDPPGTVQQTVDETGKVDHGVFLYGDKPEHHPPDVGKHGFVQLLRSLWEFLKALILRWPSQLLADAKRKLEDAVTRKFYGVEGSVQFRLDPTADEHPIDPNLGSIFDHLRAAQRVLGQRARAVAPTPQAWVELRQLCIGLADGGPMPAEVTLPMQGSSREVVTDPKLLAPNSELPRFELAPDVCGLHPLLDRFRGVVLAPCDPVETARMHESLVRAAAEIREQAEQIQQVAQTRVQEAQTARAQAAQLGAGTPEGIQFEQQAQAAQRESESAQRQADELRERAGLVDQWRVELETWVEPRLPTLMWQVGERVGGQLQLAVEDLNWAQQVVANDPVLDLGHVEKARRRTRRWWVFLFVLLILGSVIGAVFTGLVWLPLAGLILLLLGMTASFLPYHRAKYQFERRLQLLIAEREFACDLLLHSAAEVTRLTEIYRQFVQWAEILGYVVHAPWGSDPWVPPEPDTTPLPEDLPPATTYGSGVVGADQLAALANQAARELQQQGWLGDVYHQIVDSSMATLVRTEGRPADEKVTPDEDSPLTPNGARDFLLDDLRRHRPQGEARRSAFGKISSFCSGVSPESAFETVVTGDGERHDVRAFLTAIQPKGNEEELFDQLLWTPGARLAHANRVERTLVWAPEALRGTETGRASVRFVPASITDSGAHLLELVRVDLSRRLAANEFLLFEPRQAVETHREQMLKPRDLG